jgi:hypothetical protein
VTPNGATSSIRLPSHRRAAVRGDGVAEDRHHQRLRARRIGGEEAGDPLVAGEHFHMITLPQSRAWINRLLRLDMIQNFGVHRVFCIVLWIQTEHNGECHVRTTGRNRPQEGPDRDDMSAEERAFQARIDAGVKIEAKDWMPEAYRKT